MFLPMVVSGVNFQTTILLEWNLTRVSVAIFRDFAKMTFMCFRSYDKSDGMGADTYEGEAPSY